MAKTSKARKSKVVATITHGKAKRTNIPTAEYQAVLAEDDRNPIQIAYKRRNRDLDPQLVWRGKDHQDWSDLVVQAAPLFIQEKVHPKVLIDDLRQRSRETKKEDGRSSFQADLFADFNGLPNKAAATEFYRHDANWSNRMILGDSLQVMASLAEREGLRGKVQCIYIDPPYGIKFNSNFQWSTTSRDVKDGNADHITREPEQVKAFRDTWRDGIHSYLTYLRDRLTVARDLLTESGSIFVQIGDENVHRVRALMDEVFGESNFITLIKFRKTSGLGGMFLDDPFDYLIWFSKSRDRCKYRRPFVAKELHGAGGAQYRFKMDQKGFYVSASEEDEDFSRFFRYDNMTSQSASTTTLFDVQYDGVFFPTPAKGGWKTNTAGMKRLTYARRLLGVGRTLSYIRFFDDFPVMPLDASWPDTVISGFADPKTYVVQTTPRVIQRCIFMTTDPGDLVLDPTCGSGTTAYVAEQWGRRWITIDTSRVALALARARVMGARYPFYLLDDSRVGQIKEAALTGRVPSEAPTYNDIRQGFVYERVPHITLRSIANNAEINVIWERWQEALEPLLEQLDVVVSEEWKVDSRKTHRSSLPTNHSLAEWEVPRDLPEQWPPEAALHARAVLEGEGRAPARDRRLHRRQGRLRISL